MACVKDHLFLKILKLYINNNSYMNKKVNYK